MQPISQHRKKNLYTHVVHSFLLLPFSSLLVCPNLDLEKRVKIVGKLFLQIESSILNIFRIVAMQLGDNQGIYKNMVEKDRIIFEIPARLSCERGNFPTLDFFLLKSRNFKKIAVVLYPIFIHNHGDNILKVTKKIVFLTPCPQNNKKILEEQNLKCLDKRKG